MNGYGKRKGPVLVLVISALAALSFITEKGSHISLRRYKTFSRALQAVSEGELPTYTTDSIMRTAPNFPKFVPKLLVWDGRKFQVFGLQHGSTEYFPTMKYSFRYVDLIPLLVHALQTNFPDRFQPGTPTFELLFTDADSPHSDCVNTECPVDKFSPILLFGSVPKDPKVFPTMKSFPNSVFLHCLYEYQVNGKEDCKWPNKVDADVRWENLRETVVWRGADWAFMHYDKRFEVDGPFQVNQRLGSGHWNGKSKQDIVNELLSDELKDHFGPRWLAALLSVRAEDDELPWIDSRFVGGENSNIHSELSKLGVQLTGYKIDPFEMSNYKYQIDLGGGGGTTWEGTLTKMLMPGVLFHHETPNKDWYFDLLEPWKHYIPVKADLSDLYSAFQTAQNNQDKAKAVSAKAAELAQYILSSRYMARVYQELFVDYLGKVVNSYEPSNDPWPELAKRYKAFGFNLYKIGVCKGVSCKLHCRQGEESNVLVINKEAPDRTPSIPVSPSTRGASNRNTNVPPLDDLSGSSRQALQVDSSQQNQYDQQTGQNENSGPQRKMQNQEGGYDGSSKNYQSSVYQQQASSQGDENEYATGGDNYESLQMSSQGDQPAFHQIGFSRGLERQQHKPLNEASANNNYQQGALDSASYNQNDESREPPQDAWDKSFPLPDDIDNQAMYQGDASVRQKGSHRANQHDEDNLSFNKGDAVSDHQSFNQNGDGGDFQTFQQGGNARDDKSFQRGGSDVDPQSSLQDRIDGRRPSSQQEGNEAGYRTSNLGGNGEDDQSFQMEEGNGALQSSRQERYNDRQPSSGQGDKDGGHNSFKGGDNNADHQLVQQRGDSGAQGSGGDYGSSQQGGDDGDRQSLEKRGYGGDFREGNDMDDERGGNGGKRQPFQHEENDDHYQPFQHGNSDGRQQSHKEDARGGGKPSLRDERRSDGSFQSNSDLRGDAQPPYQEFATRDSLAGQQQDSSIPAQSIYENERGQNRFNQDDSRSGPLASEKGWEDEIPSNQQGASRSDGMPSHNSGFTSKGQGTRDDVYPSNPNARDGLSSQQDFSSEEAPEHKEDARGRSEGTFARNGPSQVGNDDVSQHKHGSFDSPQRPQSHGPPSFHQDEGAQQSRTLTSFNDNASPGRPSQGFHDNNNGFRGYNQDNFDPSEQRSVRSPNQNGDSRNMDNRDYGGSFRDSSTESYQRPRNSFN